MKVKAAYYMHNLPTKIAVVLPDGRAKITNLVPFRSITETELQDLAAFKSAAYRSAYLCDEMPEYVYIAYGLEKIDAQ